MANSRIFYAAACQTDLPNPLRREEIAPRARRMAEMIDCAVVGYRPFHDVRLVVFPEFAFAAPVYFTVPELIEHLALPAENEFVDVIARAAARHRIYVQTGSFLEVDPRFPDAVFNTTLLIGPDGKTLSRYRKVNPWIPWEVHTSPHDIPDYPDDPFPVVATEIGRLGVATCYDWLFPEVTRELTLKGAEILIRISAYMDPWGTSMPTDWWTLVNRTRALENMAYVVAANQAAQLSNYAPFSWPGGSMIVDFDGRILAQANPGPGEAIVVGPIYLDALREERRRRQGHAMPAHLRTSIYGRSGKSGFPPQSKSGSHSVESLDRAITESKDESGFCR